MQKNPSSIIRSYLLTFSKTEKKIANYILNNFHEISNLNIAELAKQAGVAESSVIRFTQKIGYSGFREFKIACASHNGQSNSDNYFEDVTDTKDNSFQYVLKSFIRGGIHSLEENLKDLDYDQLEKIAKLFLEKENIFIWGEGFSGHLGKGFALRLRSILENIRATSTEFEMLQDTYIMTEKDILLSISQTGKSNAVKLTKEAKESGVTVVCLTGSYNNELYNIADHSIVPMSVFNDYKSRYIGNEALFKIILDSLYVYLDMVYTSDLHPKERFRNYFPPEFYE